MKSKRQNKKKKKAYTSPRLVAYGDFRTITRATTKGGASADGGKPSSRASGPPG